METSIFRLTKENLNLAKDYLPEEILNRFGEPGVFALGALDDFEECVGVLVFYIGVMVDKLCYARVLHIFVDGDYRREGIGSSLVAEMHTILEMSGIKEVQVLIPETGEEAFDTKDFFHSTGYTFNGETVMEYRGELGSLIEKDYRRKNPELKAKPLKSLDQEKFLPMLNRIMNKTQDKEGEYAISAELIPDISVYDQDISTFYSHGETEGVFLVRSLGENIEELVYFRAVGEDVETVKSSLALMTFKCAQLVLEPENYVILGGEASGTKEFMEEFLPDAAPIVYAKGFWQEELAHL